MILRVYLIFHKLPPTIKEANVCHVIIHILFQIFKRLRLIYDVSSV